MGKVICTLSHKQPLAGTEGIILTYDAGEIYDDTKISDMAYFKHEVLRESAKPVQKKVGPEDLK